MHFLCMYCKHRITHAFSRHTKRETPLTVYSIRRDSQCEYSESTVSPCVAVLSRHRYDSYFYTIISRNRLSLHHSYRHPMHSLHTNTTITDTSYQFTYTASHYILALI